jgi:hypothetical protein
MARRVGRKPSIVRFIGGLLLTDVFKTNVCLGSLVVGVSDDERAGFANGGAYNLIANASALNPFVRDRQKPIAIDPHEHAGSDGLQVVGNAYNMMAWA